LLASSVTGLFESIGQGASAIASSRPLARQVEERYGVWQIANGKSAWPAPRVGARDHWLGQIWRSAFQHQPGAPRLLSDDQELLLWEQLIQGSQHQRDPRYLMQVASTAHAARRSWRRVHEWDLSWKQLGDWQSSDTSAFLGWCQALRDILEDRRWLTPAQLPGYLAERPDAWIDGQPGVLWWLGFAELPQAYTRLGDELDAHGARQHRFDNAGMRDANAVALEYPDVIEQWMGIAAWARALLTDNPAVSLGVVCPDLHTRRDDIEEILEDVLHPELAWRVDAPRVYHLSMGRPLPEYPIAGAALDILRWRRPRISFDTVSRVLRSPHLGGGVAELAARAALEARLRRFQRDTFSLKSLRTLAAEQKGLAQFVHCLDAAIEQPIAGATEASAWAAEFSDWLGFFGWPGDRALDGHEFQVLSAWQELLSRFASLNTVQRQWHHEAALNKLSSMASARILQLQDEQAPLQIMGIEEAPGMWFDALWLADMNDAAWPPPARPDPFIPLPLQKASGMPEATPVSMLAHARARTRDLLASAPCLRVSYALAQDDAPASLSPLLDDQLVQTLPRGATGDNIHEARTHQLLRAAPALEPVDDRQAPPLAAGPLRGGVSLLADQALCPFRALARHRLRARKLDEVTPGLNAMQRGELTHDALKRFWDRTRSRQALLAMGDDLLKQCVAESIAGALQGELADSPFQGRLLELENERLTALLLEWLAQERRRGPFRVLATEAAARVALEQMAFDVRVDRIDELDDGRWVIIDYKTGQLGSPRAWLDERIEEPQLPIYALAIPGSVAALALAGVRRGACELRGIADIGVDGLPSLTPVSELQAVSIAELKAGWEASLGERAAEHRRGAASVEPKHSQACRYCDVMPLCRIFERLEQPG